VHDLRKHLDFCFHTIVNWVADPNIRRAPNLNDENHHELLGMAKQGSNVSSVDVHGAFLLKPLALHPEWHFPILDTKVECVHPRPWQESKTDDSK
jgi:hypothetical protein